MRSEIKVRIPTLQGADQCLALCSRSPHCYHLLWVMAGSSEAPWTPAVLGAPCTYAQNCLLGSKGVETFLLDVTSRLEPHVFLGLSDAASSIKSESGVQPGATRLTPHPSLAVHGGSLGIPRLPNGWGRKTMVFP